MKLTLKRAAGWIVRSTEDDELVIPGWYGYVYTKKDYSAEVYMLIPLNVVAALVMAAASLIVTFGHTICMDRRMAYLQGRLDGMRDRITDEDINAYLLRKSIEGEKQEASFVHKTRLVNEWSKRMLDNILISPSSPFLATAKGIDPQHVTPGTVTVKAQSRN